jgi:hypothetical protein
LLTGLREPRAQSLLVTEDSLVVDLLDGRTISVPLAWYPRLLHGTPEERKRWQLIGNGEGIHWPDLDEDLSVEGLLLGRPSGESQASFKRWLGARKRRGKATGPYVGKIAAAVDPGSEERKRQRKPASRTPSHEDAIGHTVKPSRPSRRMQNVS